MLEEPRGGMIVLAVAVGTAAFLANSRKETPS
jgi:hypothetical protein